MKKVIKFIVIVFAMSTTIADATANSELFHIYTIGEKKINVKVSVLGKSISYIQDKEGEILFEQKLSVKKPLNVTFDLSELKNGEYLFVIEDKYKKQVMPIEISDEEVEVFTDKATRTNFPQLSEDNDLVAVKLIADESNDLYIDIKSEYGDVLFQEKLEGKVGMIGKKFKFETGTYQMTLKSDDYQEVKYLIFE